MSGRTWELAVEFLAGRIRSNLKYPDSHSIEDRTLKEVRPFRGSDIAVLCRSNNRCVSVAEALAAKGLRVSIAGPGLMDTPEAVLALAALRYLMDPGDSLAIAEIAHFLDDSDGQPAWFARSLSEDRIRSLCAEIPALAALDEVREQVAQLTPREALDVAMTASGILERGARMAKSNRQDRTPRCLAWPCAAVRGRGPNGTRSSDCGRFGYLDCEEEWIRERSPG